MFILDTLFASGLRFVFDKIALAADQERDDGEHLRERLLEVQMQMELGELSEEEGSRMEREILDRLQAIRAHREPQVEGDMRVTGVEASITGEFYEPAVATEAKPPARPQHPRRSRPRRR